ncbi:MAG: serine hydrolase domain-containing protein [Planctomycetales bacterium]
MTPVEDVRELGLHPQRWERVLQLINGWCGNGDLASAGIVVGNDRGMTRSFLFGKQGPGNDALPIRQDAIFLVASITKPLVGTAILTLVEKGLLTLGDRVEKYIPEFTRHRKHRITIRHLMTHTSGLPDMLPNNRELRKRQAPFNEFIQEICELTPDFPAGRSVQYQSMGIALLGETITRVTGRHYSQYLREEILEPLGMKDSALGAPDEWFAGANPKSERIVESILPEDQVGEDDWNWNSRYWRQLGAPWGGLLTTPADLGLFARMMMNKGKLGDVRILSPASVEGATRNQLGGFPDLAVEEKSHIPWGWTWRLHQPGRSETFGDLWSPSSYGHWGSTGTVLWIDPVRNAFLVFLTTTPQDPRGEFLARCSNAVQAALE